MEGSRKFLLIELHASQIHNWKKATGKWTLNKYDEDYSFYGPSGKYKPRDRWDGFRTWFGLKLSWAFWGYGEQPLLVVLSAVMFIGFFTLPFLWRSTFRMKNWPQDANWIDYLGLSASSFAGVTYGDIIPENLWARLLVTIEGGCGLVMFGFLVAALYRRISKR